MEERDQRTKGQRNEGTMDARVRVFVIPTDEELVLAEETFALLANSHGKVSGQQVLT